MKASAGRRSGRALASAGEKQWRGLGRRMVGAGGPQLVRPPRQGGVRARSGGGRVQRRSCPRSQRWRVLPCRVAGAAARWLTLAPANGGCDQVPHPRMAARTGIGAERGRLRGREWRGRRRGFPRRGGGAVERSSWKSILGEDMRRAGSGSAGWYCEFDWAERIW